MHLLSSGTIGRTVMARSLAVGAVLASAPVAAAAQQPVPPPVTFRATEVDMASLAWERNPASLALEMMPWALGDSLGGARLGLEGAVNNSVSALGLDWRFRGAQFSIAVGSASGFGNFYREQGRSYSIGAARPLGTFQHSQRIGTTIGLAAAVGVQPRVPGYSVASAGGTVSLPATLRLRFTAPAASAAERRHPWRASPALALYAAPTLAYGARQAAERIYLTDTIRVDRAEALLPQLQLGARLEGLGPLRMHLGWRYSPRASDFERNNFSLGVGIAIR